MDRCKALRSDGEQCQVCFGLNAKNGFCWHHDPLRARSRHRARSQGGRTTSGIQQSRWSRTVPPHRAMGQPQTVADAVEWARWLTFAIATGEVDKATGREINNSLKTFVALFEKAELESQVRDLVAQVAALKG